MLGSLKGPFTGALVVDKGEHVGELLVLRARALWARGYVTSAELR